MRPPGVVLALSIAISAYLLLAMSIGLSPPPNVPEGSYALIYPSDGLRGIIKAQHASVIFISGALFAAIISSKGPEILHLLALVPVGLGSENIRDLTDYLPPLLVAILLEAFWVREGFLPKWWLVARAPIVACQIIGGALLLPLSWP